MNRNDINRMFTEKVAEFIAQGYQIHTSTMGGSQGEEAKVDLYKGSEILRVLLDSEYTHTDDFDGDCLTLSVGRVTEPIRGGTIWNGRLETLSEIKLAKVGRDYYTDLDEARRAQAVSHARWRARNKGGHETVCGDAQKSVALRWLRKQPRMKTCKLEDITRMTRTRVSGAKAGISYRIEARGKTYFLEVGPARR